MLSGPEIEETPPPAKNYVPYSNSTILDHCNLPGLFFSHDSPIKEVNKRRKTTQCTFQEPIAKNNGFVQDKDGLEEQESVNESESPVKKKRKRVRKRKNKPNGLDNQKGQQKEEKTGSTNKTVPIPLNSTHIRYSSASSSSSFSEEDSENVPLKKLLALKAKIPNTSRIIEPFVENGTKRDTTEIRESSVQDQTSTLAQICVSEINDTNASMADQTDDQAPSNLITTVNQTVNLESSTAFETIRKTMGNYPYQETLPKKNDLIGFRILKMSENYVPELSEFIVGMVESISDLDLVIFVLAGNEELKAHEGGKFSLPDCNDTILDADDGLLHITWPELKDVRMVDQ